jgi:tRNA pseudouridine65 synthase
MILFADETAVFAAKPSGLLVHNSAFAGPREHTFTDVVEERCGPVVPLHRLDRGTSGVMGFAKSPDAARAWQGALATAGKHYVALVRGQLRAAVVVDHPLKDEEGVARDAKSDVAPLATSAEPRVSLVTVRLHTGRQHQVRRHLKHLSHPVIGDANYGKGPLNRALCASHGICRLALHALALVVEHPVTGARLVLAAPLPADLPLARVFPDVEARLEALVAML